MKKLLTLLLLLSIFCQVYSQNCGKEDGNINEKIIYHAVSKSTKANSIYLDACHSNVKIDDDLRVIMRCYCGNFKDFPKIKDKISKGNNECYKKIIKNIESLETYKNYSTKNKNEKKESDKANEKLQKNPLYSEIVEKQVEQEDLIRDKQIVIDSLNNYTQELLKDTLDLVKSNQIINRDDNNSTSNVQPTSNQSSAVLPKSVIGTAMVEFSEGEFILDQNDKEAINRLNLAGVIEVIIEGFASETGSFSTNYAISMSRCYEVKMYIQEKFNYTNDFILVPVGQTEDKNLRAVKITVKK